jgi:hypothetical protein
MTDIHDDDDDDDDDYVKFHERSIDTFWRQTCGRA